MMNLFSGQPENSYPTATLNDFIGALKATHQAQTAWALVPPKEKIQLLKKLMEELEKDQEILARKFAQAQGLSFSFVLENEVRPALLALRSLQEPELPANLKPFPRGFVSLILPQFFAFRLLLEKLAQGLLAGNAFFVKTSLRNQFAGEAFKLALTKVSGWPTNLVHIFHGDEELGELMITHPSVKAVIASGNPDTVEMILKSATAARKEIQLLSGFHNSALVLADVDLDHTIDKLLESCFRGMGQLPWNIQNILILESQQKEFEKKLADRLSTMTFAQNENESQILSPMAVTKKGRVESLWKRVKEEKAKVIFDGGFEEGATLRVKPMVIQDLSHCSTLQQDWLGAPVVLVSPVKYAHEMVKWTNTSYYGNVAQIFGTPEKIEKFGSQLEVGTVLGPAWIRGADLSFWGVKQSFYGNADSSAFGTFFSQRRAMMASLN